MRTLRRFLLVGTLALAIPLAPAAAPEGYMPGAPGPSNVPAGRHAFRRVRLLFDHYTWSRASRVMRGRSGSSDAIRTLADAILRKRLAVPERVPTSQRAHLTVRFQPMSREEYRPKRGTMAAWLSMGLTLREGQEPIADDVLDETVRRLKAILTEAHDAHVTGLRKELVATRAQLKADRAELEKARAAEKKLRRDVPVTEDYEELNYRIKQHGRLALTLRLELAGKRARTKAALGKIAEIKVLAEKKAAGDAVAEELEKLVRIREREVELQEQLVRQGVANTASAQAAKGRLAEARVRLIERREKIVELAGGAVLVKLNEELATLNLDTVELEAKFSQTDGMLRLWSSTRQRKLRYDEAVQQINKLEKSIEQQSGRPGELEKRLGECEPPRVTVLAKDPQTRPAGTAPKPSPRAR